ncbi:MAG: glycerophosphodiester phosphodiesterase family protein [Mariprofundaceae bacterium]|nr:glycerophosphodiester phosphodiesterase family protein [Mariprofundaceae bacterium]
MKKFSDDPRTWLVAHRGDREGGVENTLNGFRAAVESGALFAECDIQFTRDLEPVVIHDDSLKRLCDLALHVSLLDLIDLKELCYPYFTLLTLRRLLAWLEEYPQLTLFIEIKPDIRKRLDDDDIAARLVALITETVLPQIVLISESGRILDACREQLSCPLGWVAEGNEQAECRLDYVFIPCSETAMIAPWHSRDVKVGLYTVNSAATAKELMAAGADMIETNHFSRIVGELENPHDS